MPKHTLINECTGVLTSGEIVRTATASTFQATGATSSGSGAATIQIEVSNDGVVWLLAGTISLVLGTVATSDGFAIDAMWAYCRARLTAISGTGASVTVTMGV